MDDRRPSREAAYGDAYGTSHSTSSGWERVATATASPQRQRVTAVPQAVSSGRVKDRPAPWLLLVVFGVVCLGGVWVLISSQLAEEAVRAHPPPQEAVGRDTPPVTLMRQDRPTLRGEWVNTNPTRRAPVEERGQQPTMAAVGDTVVGLGVEKGGKAGSVDELPKQRGAHVGVIESTVGRNDEERVRNRAVAEDDALQDLRGPGNGALLTPKTIVDDVSGDVMESSSPQNVQQGVVDEMNPDTPLVEPVAAEHKRRRKQRRADPLLAQLKPEEGVSGEPGRREIPTGGGEGKREAAVVMAPFDDEALQPGEESKPRKPRPAQQEAVSLMPPLPGGQDLNGVKPLDARPSEDALTSLQEVGSDEQSAKEDRAALERAASDATSSVIRPLSPPKVKQKVKKNIKKKIKKTPKKKPPVLMEGVLGEVGEG